jgi:hypothetical protein
LQCVLLLAGKRARDTRHESNHPGKGFILHIPIL